MRIRVSFFAEEIIKLDYKYNLCLRSLIYSLLPENYAAFIHDIGFRYEKRGFKLFTFSRVFGEKVEDNSAKTKNDGNSYLVFKPEIHFYIASPITKILQHIASSLVRKEYIKIGKNKLSLKGIEVLSQRDFGDSVKIKMLSPMTIRSTLYTKDGKRKSYYYNPIEEEFSQLITENMKKKYFVVNGKLSNGEIRLIPIRTGKEKIIKGDNDFIIKAWDGIYELTGDSELIKLSYDTGLGEKNSQGFGMWEVWRGKND